MNMIIDLDALAAVLSMCYLQSTMEPNIMGCECMSEAVLYFTGNVCCCYLFVTVCCVF